MEFRAELRTARAQSAAGAGAVLDVLLRTRHAPELLEQLLHQVGGVGLLTDPAAASPDFSKWSREQAARLRCAVVQLPDRSTVIAAEDPWNEAALQQVARALGASHRAAAVSRRTLAAWLDGLAAEPAAPQPDERVSAAGANSPIVRFVDQALQKAFDTGASDVHFECDRTGVTVKHRLDGVLIRFARMDGVRQAEETISRLKVLAKLDITERRLPQDGRFRLRTGPGEVDVRVSIMPSVFGEDAVLRLLDKAQLRGHAQEASLDRLGFDAQDAALIRELALRPSGMLLVTGPTGSGKTTTVYASLAEINTGLEKIITIEDPVEYELPGVLQIPVNEKKGLTFARGLRSILRHDPDRILVGEIRDAETADIAVQSALTGHLVFTTVHANSVSDVVGRFRHFGIDMFGFMSALDGVVVQRLVRRLCVDCRVARAPSTEELRWLAAAQFTGSTSLFAAAGCPSCHGSGFRGRFVLAEVHAIDDSIRDLVTEGAPLSTLKARAREQGVVSLARRAAQHVAQGSTTVDEVRRVVGLPEA